MNENENVKIQEFRHSISAKVNEYISRNNLRKLGTDVAVPDESFEQFFHFSRNLVADSGLNFVTYGHFGNSHMHLNMLPGNEEEYSIGKNIYRSICLEAIRLGGTVSAEHGIGKLKTDYLVEMYGQEVVQKMIDLKRAFDPNMILGFGTMFKL